MKSEKGMTLMSVVVYVAAFFVISIIVAKITGFFYSNMSEMENSTSSNSEYNTFNMYMLKETKIGQNYIEYKRVFTNLNGDGKYEDEETGEVADNKKIVYKFSSGTTFTYINEKIYRNSVKICDDIQEFEYKSNSVVEEGKNIIEIYMVINDIAYRTSYIVSNTAAYKDEEESGKKAILGKINDGENLTISGKEQAYNNPIIPSGFMPISSAIDESISQTASWIVTGEGTASGYNNGLVIQDVYGNQFVWIPVQTEADFATFKRYDGDTLYNLGYGEDYGDSTLTEEIVLRSIKQYGGFYIARYPLSLKNEQYLVAFNSETTLSDFKRYSFTNSQKHSPKVVSTEYAQTYIPSQIVYDVIYKFLNLSSDELEITDDADRNIEGLNGTITKDGNEIKLSTSRMFWTNSKCNSTGSQLVALDKSWKRAKKTKITSYYTRPVMYVLPTY